MDRMSVEVFYKAFTVFPSYLQDLGTRDPANMQIRRTPHLHFNSLPHPTRVAKECSSVILTHQKPYGNISDTL